MANWVIGVDVGGTFTDFTARNTESGESCIHKRPSTPDDPSRAVLEGLRELKEKAGIPDDDIERFAHGTTVATNALLQRKGATVGVVTTKGFRDLLEIGRQVRPLIYDLQIDAPAPLAERENRLEVSERIGSEGQVVTELTDETLNTLIGELKALEAVDSVAVCFLFSFLNGAHEKKAATAIRAALPGLYVSTSAEVQPEFREYERFSTTLINAFLQPEVGRYMDRLKGAMSNAAPKAKFGIFQSSGGLMSVERASRYPVRTALSGPAAGAVGAAAAAGASEIENVITLDMGGTSTDVCLIQGGKTTIASMRDIAGFRIRLPMVDIHTVGAGGGSIAHIGTDGLMKVGPESAGAVPGPACYGKGGTKPTVSDANVLLGRLPRSLAGGELVVDRSKAEAAVTGLAQTLGISLTKAALGITGIVTSNMTRAIRAVSVEKGHDPRDFTLMPFGGAGGLHAADVARSLGIKRVLVPYAPGILCAEGLIQSDLQENYVATCRTPLGESLAQVRKAAASLSQQAEKWLALEAADAADGRQILSFDMRYIGQNYELPVEVSESTGTPEVPDIAKLREDFFAVHERTYGHVDREAPVEIVNLRLRVVASLGRKAAGNTQPAGSGEAQSTQEVWFSEGSPIDTPIYARENLPQGTILQGPAIITQLDATTVVPPWADIKIDSALNMIMEVKNV
ncbi:hydantoinase/oxoprolinase family protein [Pelagibius sp. Alg239-R121]|uniref:hydantoinase/oxoprolinase family protein n=1 Tax=Pelagibius sp. Alg239-R121 TaxID=2993448 RepID=UPI0024A686C5|nr:hydantoinase/oxoprolinase family protein [Pelagibius sp. Alg239-R121]